jgi:hypothetical protein
MKAYEYLGVEDRDNVEHKNEKEKLKKARARRLGFIFNAELSA